MKASKFLFTLAMIAMSLLSFGQLITLTQPNPAFQPVNNWPGGNSWNMLVPMYNDFVSLNAASNNSANAAFTTISPYVAATGLTLNGLRENVINDSSLTAVTLTIAQSGSVVMLKALAGDTIVLPASAAANIGATYTIQIAVSATSVGHTIKTSGTDVFYGAAFMLSTTTASPFTSTANKTMQLSTTTTGGLRGTKFVFVLMSGGRWATSGTAYCTGSVATPFAN